MAHPKEEWIKCVLPLEKNVFPGSKIHFSECVFCSVEYCDRKGVVFSWFFPRLLTLDDTSLNRKLVKMNFENSKKKRGRMRRFCPVRRAGSRSCSGLKTFCRYNMICGRYTGKERHGNLFIRSIRWREVMMYVVKFEDGTVKTMKKSEFNDVDIDSVDKVFTGNYEIKVVSELVPKGEEQEHFSEILKTFREKYKGCVVNGDGIVTFGEWFREAEIGESAVIPGKILVPQKKYKVVRIKAPLELRKMGLEENESLFMEEAEKEKKRKSASEKTEKKQEKTVKAKTGSRSTSSGKKATSPKKRNSVKKKKTVAKSKSSDKKRKN